MNYRFVIEPEIGWPDHYKIELIDDNKRLRGETDISRGLTWKQAQNILPMLHKAFDFGVQAVKIEMSDINVRLVGSWKGDFK